MGIAWQLSGQAFFVTVYNDKKYNNPNLNYKKERVASILEGHAFLL